MTDSDSRVTRTEMARQQRERITALKAHLVETGTAPIHLKRGTALTVQGVLMDTGTAFFVASGCLHEQVRLDPNGTKETSIGTYQSGKIAFLQGLFDGTLVGNRARALTTIIAFEETDVYPIRREILEAATFPISILIGVYNSHTRLLHILTDLCSTNRYLRLAAQFIFEMYMTQRRLSQAEQRAESLEDEREELTALLVREQRQIDDLEATIAQQRLRIRFLEENPYDRDDMPEPLSQLTTVRPTAPICDPGSQPSQPPMASVVDEPIRAGDCDEATHAESTESIPPASTHDPSDGTSIIPGPNPLELDAPFDFDAPPLHSDLMDIDGPAEERPERTGMITPPPPENLDDVEVIIDLNADEVELVELDASGQPILAEPDDAHFSISAPPTEMTPDVDDRPRHTMEYSEGAFQNFGSTSPEPERIPKPKTTTFMGIPGPVTLNSVPATGAQVVVSTKEKKP